jgi:deoxyadenosine/deoxycytidine kinase
MPKPDLYVYLHSNTDKLMQHIKFRGRDYEKNITPDYLEKIKNGYFNFFKKINSFPILVIDVNNVDFVQNPDHYQQIKEALFNSDYKLGVNRLIL